MDIHCANDDSQSFAEAKKLLSIGMADDPAALEDIDKLYSTLVDKTQVLTASVAALVLWHLDEDARSRAKSAPWDQIHEFARYSLLELAATFKTKCFREQASLRCLGEDSWQFRLKCCSYLMSMQCWDAPIEAAFARLKDELDAGQIRFIPKGHVPAPEYRDIESATEAFNLEYDLWLRAREYPKPRD